MDSRGQVSAEYLLLILVVLIILGSVTIPLVGRSIDASMDISQVSDAKTAVESIANAVNVVYSNGPGAKRTINVYIPQDTNLVSDNAAKCLTMTVTLSDGSKTVNGSTSYNTTVPNPSLTKGWHTIEVYWNATPNNNIITIKALS